MRNKIVVLAAAVMVACSLMTGSQPVKSHMAQQFFSNQPSTGPETMGYPGGYASPGWASYFSKAIGGFFGRWAGRAAGGYPWHLEN